MFDTSFYTALYAVGRIKENALISPMMSLLSFPVVYVLFVMGASPLALSWVSIIVFAIAGCLIKPFLIVRIASYSWKEIFNTINICLIVTLVAIPIPLIAYIMLDVQFNLWHDSIVLVLSVVCVATSVWFLGLTKNMKKMLFLTVKSKFRMV